MKRIFSSRSVLALVLVLGAASALSACATDDELDPAASTEPQAGARRLTQSNLNLFYANAQHTGGIVGRNDFMCSGSHTQTGVVTPFVLEIDAECGVFGDGHPEVQTFCYDYSRSGLSNQNIPIPGNQNGPWLTSCP